MSILNQQERKKDSFTYDKKMTISGNHIRYQTFTRTILKGFSQGENQRKGIKRLEGEKQENNLFRARMNLIDTINCNITKYSKFITLTTAEPCLDRNQFMQWINDYQTYFKRKFQTPLKYVAVTERQLERGSEENNQGSWHIHIIIFNDMYLPFDKLKPLWKYGSTDIKVIDSTENLGVYMAKYLTKQEIALNKKSVLKSRGLKAPFVEYNALPPSSANLEKTFEQTRQYVIDTTGEVIQSTITEYIIATSKSNVNIS